MAFSPGPIKARSNIARERARVTLSNNTGLSLAAANFAIASSRAVKVCGPSPLVMTLSG